MAEINKKLINELIDSLPSHEEAKAMMPISPEARHVGDELVAEEYPEFRGLKLSLIERLFYEALAIESCPQFNDLFVNAAPLLRAAKAEVEALQAKLERYRVALEMCELAIRTAVVTEVGGQPVIAIHTDFRDEVLGGIWKAIGRIETRDPELDAISKALSDGGVEG